MNISWGSRKFEANGLVVLFSLIAVVLRIAFWAYTGRVWEDSLIALASVQNMWDGLGLTQHVGEAPIYSFSSPLDVIVLALGEWARQGITVIRLASLASSVIAIVLAGKIFERCDVNRVGQIACFSYLACDHLQIFFGMSGMETQMATALGIALVYFSISQNAWAFGVSCGLAILARLELAVVVAVCAIPFLVDFVRFVGDTKTRGRIVKIAIATFGLLVPWVAFTTIYYGTPVPQTVTVKSFANGSPGLSGAGGYLDHMWKQVAPFREFWFVNTAPLPDALLKIVVAVMVLLALVGLFAAIWNRSPIWTAGLSALGFWTYMVLCHVNPYFMWYTPPFIAITFLTIAYGISALNSMSRSGAIILSTLSVVAYAIHLPFTLPLDRMQQISIEDGVRQRTGIALREMMKPGDTVYLEPLGYVGSEVRTRTVYDNPGLASKVAFQAYKKYGYKMMEALRPNFLVLRVGDIPLVESQMPDLLSGYTQCFHIDSGTGNYLSLHGLSYSIGGDHEFFIYKRKSM
ncbi:hypothetical protein [Paraburkholderia phosphatilytica]|uniref:hypothetical protein n=1 Tax=Paraburkholderia phosphatilytica TaxID=2282883 RepID=UPI000E513BA8|nr:hypothetical protein [Paraburkholderia phosphatilytica]